MRNGTPAAVLRSQLLREDDNNIGRAANFEKITPVDNSDGDSAKHVFENRPTWLENIQSCLKEIKQTFQDSLSTLNDFKLER